MDWSVQDPVVRWRTWTCHKRTEVGRIGRILMLESTCALTLNIKQLEIHPEIQVETDRSQKSWRCATSKCIAHNKCLANTWGERERKRRSLLQEVIHFQWNIRIQEEGTEFCVLRKCTLKCSLKLGRRSSLLTPSLFFPPLPLSPSGPRKEGLCPAGRDPLLKGSRQKN
jgi:hypothetical protein